MKNMAGEIITDDSIDEFTFKGITGFKFLLTFFINIDIVNPNC